MGSLNIYSGQKTAEKNLHSWTKFADSDGCLLHRRSSDIRTQTHDRVSLGSIAYLLLPCPVPLGQYLHLHNTLFPFPLPPTPLD